MLQSENHQKDKIAIIGGGAAGMMCAMHLDANQYDIHLYEAGKRLGSKLLVAGKGGFNLTHGTDMQDMIKQYTSYPPLHNALQSFTNKDLVTWLGSIGIKTFVGSSNRVFPIEEIKPRDVLYAFFDRLAVNAVQINRHHRWIGWNEDRLLFLHNNNEKKVKADIVIFALGGSSWKKTGSDGQWASFFTQKNISLSPFAPANCALGVDWSDRFIASNSGKPLKNINLKYRQQNIKGELMITDFGLEGSPVYAISNRVGMALENSKEEKLYIDFKPTYKQPKTLQKLVDAQHMSISDRLRRVLRLDNPAVQLIKQATSKDDFMDVNYLSHLIHHFPIVVRRVADMDEAISTSGGIKEAEISDNFELTKIPNHYAIGEMLDWSAPTGGYLLQASFSMGWYLAQKINRNYAIAKH